MAEDVLSDEESLFTAPGILEIEYLPRLLPYREEKQKYLASMIKRLPSIGSNALITGPPGIGKTACVRWVLRELTESENSEAFPVYINCWRNSDMQKMTLQLCSIFGINTAYHSPGELNSAVFKRLKDLKAVVLAFDEVDRLADQTILYNFLEELQHKVFFLISSKMEWLAHLDERVRSRLVPEVIEFEPYDREQTRGILLERRKHAFVPDAWDEDAFEMVVSECFKAKDIRAGLALLKSSGLVAEKEASRKVKKEHVVPAVRNLGISEKPDGKDKRITDFG